MSDRHLLEEGEARILYFTWKVTQDRVLTDERKQWITSKFGPGAVNRIQAYMLAMHKADLELAGLSQSTES